MSYKAIIFDLDGTLLDTLQDLATSVNAVLKSYELAEHPVAAYRYFVGDGIEVLVQRAFPDGLIDEQGLDLLVAAVKEEYSQHWSDQTRPYPGVAELLSYLETKEIPKAIFSNKPHEYTLLTVEKLLPGWTFSHIYGINEDMPRKPDPHGALLIAEQLSLKPEEIVYLGDTDTDMQTAVSGGFFPVGATWGFRNPEELLAGGAKKLAARPEDLAELFA
jgi:phosphoglycolate phosphatase